MKEKYMQVMVLVDKYNLLNDKGWGSMTNHGDGYQGLQLDLPDISAVGSGLLLEVLLYIRDITPRNGDLLIYTS